jgi:hypothetical protein
VTSTQFLHSRKTQALKQALCILKCISEGRSTRDIVEEFDGDEQLVLIWIDFLKEHGWLVEGSSKLTATENGRLMIGKWYETSVLYELGLLPLSLSFDKTD